MVSLQSLIEKMIEADEGNEEISDEKYQELIGDIRFKVDAIKEFISAQETEAQRLQDDYIKPIQARKKQIENNIAGLKKWIISVMEFNQYPFLNGDLFTIKMSELNSVEYDNVDISNLFYMQNKDVVRKKYELDKPAIKEKIKLGKTFEFARPVKTKSIRFNINKKGNKK